MKLRRALFVVAVLSLLSLLVVPAQAAADNPYWKVETNVPVKTIQGEWNVAESGKRATLEFQGANLIAQETTFTAGWLSPWVRATHLEVGEFNVVADPIASGSLKVMTRIQVKGQGWGPWFRLPMSWADGGGGYLWAGGASTFGRHLVRYDWKMIGTVTGTAHIEGSAEVSVD